MSLKVDGAGGLESTARDEPLLLLPLLLKEAPSVEDLRPLLLLVLLGWSLLLLLLLLFLLFFLLLLASSSSRPSRPDCCWSLPLLLPLLDELLWCASRVPPRLYSTCAPSINDFISSAFAEGAFLALLTLMARDSVARLSSSSPEFPPEFELLSGSSSAAARLRAGETEGGEQDADSWSLDGHGDDSAVSPNGVPDADALGAGGFAGRDACKDEADPSLPRALELEVLELPESLSSVDTFVDDDPLLENSDEDDMKPPAIRQSDLMVVVRLHKERVAGCLCAWRRHKSSCSLPAWWMLTAPDFTNPNQLFPKKAPTKKQT